MADLCWTEPEDRDGKLTVWSCLKLDGQFFPGVSSLDDPGACIAVPRATRMLKKDKLKSLGRSTNRLIHHGVEAAEIEIEVEMWTIEQYRAWLKYLPKISPMRRITKTTKTTKIVAAAGPPAPAESVVQVAPVGDVETTTTLTDATAKVTETHTTAEIPSHEIDHPDLAPLGIRHLFITEIPTLEPPENGGVRKCKIKATEVLKPSTGNRVVTKGVAVGQKVNDDRDVLPEFKLNTRPR